MCSPLWLTVIDLCDYRRTSCKEQLNQIIIKSIDIGNAKEVTIETEETTDKDKIALIYVRRCNLCNTNSPIKWFGNIDPENKSNPPPYKPNKTRPDQNG